MGREKKKGLFSKRKPAETDFLFFAFAHIWPARTDGQQGCERPLTLSKALAKEREREGEGRTSTLEDQFLLLSPAPPRRWWCTCIFVNNSTPPPSPAAAAGLLLVLLQPLLCFKGEGREGPPYSFSIGGRSKTWRAATSQGGAGVVFSCCSVPYASNAESSTVFQDENRPIGSCFLSMQLSRNERPRAPVAPCSALLRPRAKRG